MQNLSAVKWLAPAKINRFLHIVGQRDDGYHLLQSVFVFLDIADELIIRSNASDQITFDASAADLVTADNLCLKAAELLKVRVTAASDKITDVGADIFLQKNIPVGGGLGGGSSDAATVLMVLNKLWSVGLSQRELLEIGLQLGADVPFFIQGQAAWVEGVGEKITPVSQLADEPVLLIFPPLSVPTISVYADPDLRRDTAKISDWPSMDLTAKIASWHNDMEAVVLKQHPELTELFEITADIGNIRMSGSGSTFFVKLALKETEVQLAEVISELSQKGYGSQITSTQGISRLHQQLAENFH